MRHLIFFPILFFIFSNCVEAQSDTLVIKLNDGKIDKIAIAQLKKISFENITGIEDQTLPAKNLAVAGNSPNPFADQTDIEFEIANSGIVEIMIYDNIGNRIHTLKCENCPAGKNSLPWNCTDMRNNRVQNGVYFYEVRFGNDVQSRKMIVIK
ncbi:MAG: Por secretion system C-terminal sorting protein [Ignavibacteria bacterium]|nr:Por secretion system C-terminal sorting protein [Ignavibacteria bacterium]